MGCMQEPFIYNDYRQNHAKWEKFLAKLEAVVD